MLFLIMSSKLFDQSHDNDILHAVQGSCTHPNTQRLPATLYCAKNSGASMVLKLQSTEDILKLPPLPVEIRPIETKPYWGTADEITEAYDAKTTWLPRWLDGRLYRVRIECLWETKH